MSTKENKELMRRLYADTELMSPDAAKRRAVHERYAGPSYVYHNNTFGDLNFEQMFKVMNVLLAAFPDIRYSVDDMIAEGDRVATRYTMTATHTGAYAGIQATGKPIKVNGVEVVRIADGKIAESWDLLDSISMLRQLGALPPTALNK